MEHTSQGLSRRLHDKGYRGEHTHVWVHHYCNGEYVWTLCLIDEDDTVNKQIPAYTFSELWGVLPMSLEPEYESDELDWGKLELRIEKDVDDTMFIAYVAPSDGAQYESVSHESPAEAVGLLMEWLIDNGHITLFTMEGTPHEQ